MEAAMMTSGSPAYAAVPQVAPSSLPTISMLVSELPRHGLLSGTDKRPH